MLRRTSLCLVMAVAGCAGRQIPDTGPLLPKYGPEATELREQAVADAVEALRSFRREYLSTRRHGKKPDTTAPLADLRRAVEVLRPGGKTPTPPEWEEITEDLEAALQAMQAIASNPQNPTTYEESWALFDAAVLSLGDALRRKCLG